MATNYPGSVDSPVDPTPTDPMNNPSHAGEHDLENDAIVAIENTVGFTGSFNFLPVVGGSMSGPIAMGTNKITGLANGSAPTDAANVSQITGGACGVSGVPGACGVSGVAGSAGACGVSGVAGACGVSGTAGVAGACGISGTAGSAGACGVSGTAGSAGACGVSGVAGACGVSGVVGACGVSGVAPGFAFTFSTSTSSADPGAGKWAFNSATPASVTQMYVDKLDYATTDVHPWLAALGTPGGILYLTNASTPTNFWTGSVQSSTSESAGAYYLLAVTYIDGSSGLPDTTAGDFIAYWSPSGACGVSGVVGACGVSGTAGSAGACGVSGTAGSAGACGVSGVSGVAGACGVSGVSGVSGPPDWPITVVSQTLSGNAVTVAVTTQSSKLTNNSSATATITLATSGAVDGQSLVVRFYDFAAAAETLTWVNTENSTVSVPATSNGSTTLPVTVAFVFNGGTSKWRCAGVA